MTERLKKICALILSLAAAAVLMAGCNRDDEDDIPLPDVSNDYQSSDYFTADSVFSLNYSSESSFNPLSTPNSSNFLCSQLMYDNMFEVDASFNFSTRVIKDYKSDDGISWFFYVDTDVSFWDGSKLTAADVAYSLQRAKQSTRFKDRLSVVQGVSAMDGELVLVSTYRANTLLPAVLSIPIIKDGSMEERAPQGTGPYMPDSGFTKLTAFSGNGRSHPLDEIYLKEVVGIEEGIAAFENSELDIVLNDPTSFTNLGYGTANDVRSYPTTNMHYIGFNSESRFFSNVLFRRAMNYLVNRDEIVSSVLKGSATAAVLPMNPICGLYNDSYSELYSYSYSKGLDALEEATVTDADNDGLREIEVTGINIEIDINFIVCSDSAQKVAAARIVAKELEDLGITVTLRELSWYDYITALVTGDFDMYYAEVKLTADFDPTILMREDGLLNYGKFNLEALENTVAAYLASDDETRQRNASLMFRDIVENAPIVTICFERHQVITHRGVVIGMKPSQYNPFYNLDEWTVKFD